MMTACSSASIITFTHTGLGTGQIGPTSFTNANFTITETADTANRQSIGGPVGFLIDDSSASIAISGVGTFTFLTPTLIFVNNTSTRVGFSRADTIIDLFDGPVNTVFATYDLTTSIGPISGSGTLQQWQFSPVNISGGSLGFIPDPQRH
jgi:hypothetical protein